jgi:hypothetical protein
MSCAGQRPVVRGAAGGGGSASRSVLSRVALRPFCSEVAEGLLGQVSHGRRPLWPLAFVTDHGHRRGGRADAGKRESITKWLHMDG